MAEGRSLGRRLTGLRVTGLFRPSGAERRANRRRLGRRGRVHAVLAALSPVPLLVSGGLLAHEYRDQARERTVVQGIDQAAVVAQLLSTQATFVDPGPHNQLSQDEVRRLAAFAEAQIGQGTFLRLTVISPSRSVIYSSDPSGENERLDDSPNTIRALSGRPSGTLVEAGPTGATQPGGQPVLAVLAPVHDPETQAALGVIELRLPVPPIALADFLDRNRVLLAAVGAALAGLHLTFVGLLARSFARTGARAELAEHRATHDALTGLPNYSLLADRIAREVARAERERTGVAVVMVDLNRFQEINDALGHHNGDLLLIEVAHRLRGGIRAQDTVARLGSDKFAILLPGVADRTQLESALAQARAGLEEEVVLDGLPLHVEAGLGAAFAPGDGSEPDLLLQRADVARHVAKRTHSGLAFFEAQQDNHSTDRLALIGELRRALERDELVLHYQPQVHQRDGRVHCLEALVRWQHPTRGLLGPDLFVPIAEQTGLIDDLTVWVLDHALTQLKQWRSTRPDLGVAVNVSARSLHDLAFPQALQDVLFHTGVEPDWLLLEITETALVVDAARAALVLGDLRWAGFRLSLDDFGQGYTSLSQLSSLPFNELKIDKGFVMNMQRNPNDAAIVHLVIDLAHHLGLEVVAEGVEDAETLEALVALGCDITQGYHFSRPLPADQVMKWMAEHDATLRPARSLQS